MELIVADLDGSIVYNNEISEDDKIAIKNWNKSGNIFTLATGRPLIRAIKFIEQLNIKFPVILCNGAAVYKRTDNSENFEIINNLSKEKINKLLSLINEINLLNNVILFYGRKIQILNGNTILLNNAKKWNVNFNIIGSMKNILDEPILMLSFYHPDNKLRELLPLFLNDFHIELSSDNYIDILPKNISKGKTLKKILENFKFDNVYVIGDALNDLSMIFGSNKLVAVDNAVKEVKNNAYIVANSNKENPVKDFIKTLYQKRGKIYE